jgi:hypothetical protein
MASNVSRRHLSKKVKECLQQRKLFLERAQLRLLSLRPDLDPASKKSHTCVKTCFRRENL